MGKAAVVGMKDRETNQISPEVVESTDGLTLLEVVLDHVVDGARIHTDEHRGYHGLPNHQTVNHSAGKYVDGMAHTNGIESFWTMLKRGHHGTYHKMRAKHLDRYVQEFAGRHNARSAGLYARTVEERRPMAVFEERLTLMSTITIELDDDTQKILAKLVKESGTSESVVIANAIRIANGSGAPQVFGPKGVV